jgi:hypothetical protein
MVVSNEEVDTRFTQRLNLIRDVDRVMVLGQVPNHFVSRLGFAGFMTFLVM